MIKLSRLWAEHVRPVFAVDLRSLALLRLVLGVVLCFDSLARLGAVGAFYTDAGVMPRELLAAMDAPWRWSLHMASGAAWFQVLLMLAQAVSGAALALGWHSRAASLLGWLLTVSICNRNPMVLGSGDILLCALLFWSLFLPLSARWSIDAALSRAAPPADHRHVSWASAALVLQVLSVPLFGALLRSGREWWPDLSAGYYVLSLDSSVSALGRWLLTQPGLLSGLTGWSWWLQLVGPLLLLLPSIGRPGKAGPTQLLRAAVLLQLALLQLLTWLSTDTGNFPWVMLAGLCALPGAHFWQWRWQRHERRQPGGNELRIYYDRDCGFCLKSCRLLVQMLVLPQARLAPAQDNRRADALLRANNSWVVIDHDDTAHLKSAAMLLLLRRSPLLARLGSLLQRPGVLALGDRVYDWVARNRAMLARISARLLPERDRRFVVSPRKQRFAGLALLLVLANNIAGLSDTPGRVESLLEPPLGLLGIEQRWDQHAPSPSRQDGWWVVPGKLADGTDVDVLHADAGPARFDKPASPAAHDGFRWRSYQRQLGSERYAAPRLEWSRYLCRQWNRGLTSDSPRWLIDFKLIDMVETTPPPGARGSVEQHVLWRQECAATPRLAPPARAWH